MTLARYNIRLPAALDKSLRTLAEREGISAYATLQRCVKAGIAAQANPPARDLVFGEVVSELASVSTRMVGVERLLDRALFTACAAYCYARSAALGSEDSDEDITADINAAYDRQRQRAQEDR